MTENRTQPSISEAAPTLQGRRAVLRDLAQMIRFYSRIPVPKLPMETDAHALPDFSTAPRMVAIAGLFLGIPPAFVIWLAANAGLPVLVSAALAVAVAILVTGAFHEDGLADTFDGLAGGTTPERRLDIMKDSRIGAFGGAALIVGLVLRISALAGLLEESTAGTTALIMLAAASLSRSLGLVPLVMLPNARPGGFSSSVGRPGSPAFITTLLLSLISCGALAGLISLSVFAISVACLLALLPVCLLTWWSLRAIHGQTGDIAGAAQQMSEIAFYIGLLVVLGWIHG